MSDRSLEERIRLRIFMEGNPQEYDMADGVLEDWQGDMFWRDDVWAKVDAAARIAALEVEDSAAADEWEVGVECLDGGVECISPGGPPLHRAVLTGRTFRCRVAGEWEPETGRMKR